MYVPSNGAIANIICRDLGLHFHDHEIYHVNILKTVRASEECSIMTFIEVLLLLLIFI